jgi:CHAT domain-containing protein
VLSFRPIAWLRKWSFVLLGLTHLACIQAQEKPPETVTQEPLVAGFSARRTIGANVVHRYILPRGGNLYVHATINQVSVDLSAKIIREDGTSYTVDATNLGWESVPIVLHNDERSFLDLELRNRKAQGGVYELQVKELRPLADGDEEHVAAAIAATEARRSSATGTREAVERALRNYEGVLPLWRRSGDRFGEVMTLLSLATLSYTDSQFQQGEQYSKQAVELARALNDRLDEGLALNNQAQCQVPLGMLNAARANMTTASEAFRETGSLFAVVAARINLGVLDYQTGHWTDALKEYAEARTLTRQIGDQRLEVFTLTNAATVYLALGDRQAAASFLEQILVASKPIGDNQAAARAMSNLGRVKLESGKIKEAEQLIRKALESLRSLPDRRAEADALNYLGMAVEKRSASEASAHYEEALKLFQGAEDRRGESTALLNLGRLLADDGKVDIGIQFLHRSLEIRREIAVFDLEAECLYSLALAERARNNLDASVDYVEEALRIVESSRMQAPGEWLRSNYMAKRGEIYDLAIDLQMELYRRNPQLRGDRTALVIHERMLARALIDRLGISREQLIRGVDAILLKRSSQLADLISLRSNELLHIFERPHNPSEEKTARAKLEAALAEHRLEEAQIRASSQEYRNMVEPDRLSIEQIQRDLVGKDGLLLEFSLGKTQSYLWAVTNSDFHSYTLPGRDHVETLATRFLNELLQPPHPNSVHRSSAALGELLKRPLADHPGKTRLFIVAEGKLLQVPFAAIQLSPSRYLVDSWEPSLWPSAQAGFQFARRALERHSPGREFAILADPVFSLDDERVPNHPRVYSAPRYPRLAFTRQEAEAILALRPSPSNLKALDFAASVATAERELGAYRLVHFSSHAYVDAEHPESSGVVLSLVDSNGREQEGILRLAAIVNMQLRADLVVLSACQTATGRDVRTEGILGLTQGFVYGGAQQVVSSLWSVDEFAARQLMLRFYQGLLVRGLKPPAAMRAAQLSMKHTKAWASPARWAAFVVYGYSK